VNHCFISTPQSLSLHRNCASPPIYCRSNLRLAVDWKLPLTHGVAEELRLAFCNLHAVGIERGSLQVSESTDSSSTKFTGKLDRAHISVLHRRLRAPHCHLSELKHLCTFLLQSIIISRSPGRFSQSAPPQFMAADVTPATISWRGCYQSLPLRVLVIALQPIHVGSLCIAVSGDRRR
jgi:hypothetical protein